MKISIITPTFNSEDNILKNVNSILNQTYQNFEQILIDNESHDRTLSMAKEAYRIKNSSEKLLIIREKDKGIAEAFNKGIDASSGDIIGILNSDDYYYTEMVLEKITDTFRKEDILYVHGDLYFDDPVYGSNVRIPLMCSITKALPFNHPTMFFRRKVYNAYGFFDSEYSYAMDFEFICRLVKKVHDFYRRGIYLKGIPLVTMAAGGVTWKNELASLKETQRALKKYGFWNFDAKKSYIGRIVRTKFKYWFSAIKMERVVMIWRNRKWGN